MKSSTHVISQKNHLDEVFIQTNIIIFILLIVEKLLSFELCWRHLYQNPFYMFIKMLNEIKEELPPK
jgi:hypothetical protein